MEWEGLSEASTKLDYKLGPEGSSIKISCVQCGYECTVCVPWGEIHAAVARQPITGAAYQADGVHWSLQCPHCRKIMRFGVGWQEVFDWSRIAKANAQAAATQPQAPR